MAERSRYDLFMDELSTLEKQVYFLVQKNRELADNVVDSNKVNKNLEKENEILKLRIQELETKLANSSSQESGINMKAEIAFDKDLMKKQIDDLVTVIDYHLSS